ncbi:hypothetical protein D3C85_1268030 [compost metagenome]
MRASASGSVARSSVRCFRKVLIAPILSMASSVTASPPRLYSPIFTNSSTSWYLAMSSRNLPAARLCSGVMTAFITRLAEASTSMAG